jgi:hypothetical protein
MQDQDALVDGSDLGSDRTVLARQHIENAADGWGNLVTAATFIGIVSLFLLAH